MLGQNSQDRFLSQALKASPWGGGPFYVVGYNP
jgi:hypothetical protein